MSMMQRIIPEKSILVEEVHSKIASVFQQPEIFNKLLSKSNLYANKWHLLNPSCTTVSKTTLETPKGCGCNNATVVWV